MKEYIIDKLTELLIKQEIEEKQNKTNIYVKKTECYKSLIKFVKETLLRIQKQGKFVD